MKIQVRFLGISVVVLLMLALSAVGEEWSQRYADSLPDSAFAVVETTRDGKKVRHFPHHNNLGELDVYHLKMALVRIHDVKWVVPENASRAKIHLEQHYKTFKRGRAQARGLKGPVNINRASVSELRQLPHIGEKRAQSIVEYRKGHGGFKRVGDLRRVPGIGPKIFRDIEDIVDVE
jgi:competence ComEA-like helix-hairpin-helix protein